MTIQRIADLTPKCKTDCIEIRIIKKWKMFQRSELRLLTVDEHGDTIEASTDAHSGPHFDDIIRPKTCYRVTGFVCVEGKTSNKVVDRDAMILFGKSATFLLIERDTIPAYYFEFAPYSALHARMLDKNKVLADFIGRYIDATEVPNRTKKGLLRVRLQDESRMIIPVALWQEIAATFNRTAAESDPDLAVIAITSLKVSTYGGQIQLGSTSASETYVNPCITQLPALIQRFKHMPAHEMPSRPSRNEHAESNLKTLSEIMNHLHEKNKLTTYMCLAKVADIHLGDGKDWFYPSCIKCPNKVYEASHQYYCTTHGFRDEHSYCYRFTATITDDNCNAVAVFFNNIVTSLTSKTCYDMVVTVENDDPKKLPKELCDLINKPFIFEIQLKSDYQNEEMTTNKVYEAPQTASVVTTPHSSSSTVTPDTPTVKTPKRTREQGPEQRLKQKAKEQ